MTRIQIEIYDEIIEVIRKIRNINDSGIELIIPEGAVLLDNKINLHILEKEAEKLDKVIHFITTDEFGLNLVNQDSKSYDNTNVEPTTDDGFVTMQVPIEEHRAIKEKTNFKISLPKIKIKNKVGLFLILILLTSLLGGGIWGYNYLLDNYPEAEIKLSVNSQPLTKSLQIRVEKDITTSSENLALKGYEIQTFVTEKISVDATGEKEVGEKATGAVKIFNKTSEDQFFSRGTILIFAEQGLEFETLQDVTVPARTEDEDASPPIIIAGEAEVQIQALNIGSQYNIVRDQNFEIKNISRDNFSARNEIALSGGKSEIVKIITEEDRAKAQREVNNLINSKIDQALKDATAPNRTFITGSQVVQVRKESFSANVGDEKKDVSYEREVLVLGLSYSQGDLDSLIDEMLEEFVPSNFVLSSRDRDINVSILGNSTTTVLNNEIADLQVTIRTAVVTDLNEDEIRAQVVNKDAQEVDNFLKSIRNIRSYEVNMEKTLPFSSTLPRNPENIKVTLEN